MEYLIVFILITFSEAIGKQGQNLTTRPDRSKMKDRKAVPSIFQSCIGVSGGKKSEDAIREAALTKQLKQLAFF